MAQFASHWFRLLCGRSNRSARTLSCGYKRNWTAIGLGRIADESIHLSRLLSPLKSEPVFLCRPYKQKQLGPFVKPQTETDTEHHSKPHLSSLWFSHPAPWLSLSAAQADQIQTKNTHRKLSLASLVHPAVVVVAVVPAPRTSVGRQRQRIMPVKSSASFRLTALPMVIMAQLLAAAVLTLTLVWVLHFRGGVSWERNSNVQYVYTAHPLFMVIGLVICTGEAVMAYRIILGPREAKKAVHLLLHLVALAFAAVGLYASFKYHRDYGYPDIHSLHSWLGIATVALYALQWLVAFVCFVFPGAVMTMRADYAPWHIFFGIVIFLMAVCTAETGLARFTYPFNDLPSEAFVINFAGLAILMFGVAVVLAVILPSRY